jgi:hypothetical protein
MVGLRTLLGTLLVLVSVVAITTMPKKAAVESAAPEASGNLQPAEGD